VFHAVERIDVRAPAARTPDQGQCPVRRQVGQQADAPAIEGGPGFTQTVQPLVGSQRPVERPVAVAGRPDRQPGTGHALAAPGQAQTGIGAELQASLALRQAPAARGQGLAFHFPDRLLTSQQHVGLALCAQGRFAGLQPDARTTAQPEHPRRVGLDPQAPFIGVKRPFDAGRRRNDRAGLENLVRQFDGGRHSVILWALDPQESCKGRYSDGFAP